VSNASCIQRLANADYCIDGRPLRVLHLPSSVGGNAWGLAQGERALGLNSEVLTTSDNWLGYRADISLNLENNPHKLGKLLGLTRAFLSVRNKYDVFHFNAGSSLIHSIPYRLNHLDLPFYPETAKIFVTYNGCDARQKFPTMRRTNVAPCHNPRCYHGMCNYGAYDELRRRSILKMARYARHMWAVNPDLLHFLPPEKSSFLPYAIQLPERPTAPLKLDHKKLKIVHAPTNREAKGSAFILAALDRLKRTHGEYFELQLVENTPHEKALEIYRQADLVVDQVVISWYGGFAVEAMAMGKPVISGRVSDDIKFVSKPMADEVVKAVICADPHTIHEVLLRCLEDRAMLKERAQAGLAYVRKWHDPRYVGSLTKERYEAG
jgi:hypothetical protein